MPTETRPLLNMMDHVFFVRRWKLHFETPESERRAFSMSWVSIPNKHDGGSYARATQVKHVEAAFCGWYFLVQVASKMPVRGLLATMDGPLDAEELSLKTRIPKRAFMTALSAFSDEKIGWIGRLPWDEKLDFWQNVEHLRATSEACAHLHTPDDARAQRRTGKDKEKPKAVPRDVQRDAHTSARPPHTSANVRTSAHTSAEVQLQYSTVHNSTNPPTVPQGGQAVDFNSLSFREKSELIQAAKKRTCGLGTFKGKDASRAWSRDAMAHLSDNLPVPEEEWAAVEWFHGLPADDSVQELKNRRQSETTLWQYWSDEVTRARAYQRKVGSASVTQKKEPRFWREFFVWKYGAEIRFNGKALFSATFEELPADQRAEYQRDFETFLASDEGKEVAA